MTKPKLADLIEVGAGAHPRIDGEVFPWFCADEDITISVPAGGSGGLYAVTFTVLARDISGLSEGD